MPVQGPPLCPFFQHPADHWMELSGDPFRPEMKERYPLHWCPLCQYGFSYPRPTYHEVRSAHAYQDYYTHSVSQTKQEERRPFLQKLREHLAWRIDKGVNLYRSLKQTHLSNSNMKICDIGCGNGDLAFALQKDGHRLVCVEVDPAARKIAGDRGLIVLDGTAESLPEELDRDFDVVILSHVLEHCLDPISALKKAYLITKKGGLLICEVPNNQAAALALLGNAWRWLDVPRHVNFFTKQSLQIISRLCDWQDAKFEYTGFFRMLTSQRLNEERAIWKFYQKKDSTSLIASEPHVLKYWLMLGLGAVSPPHKKYDSIRLIARK